MSIKKTSKLFKFFTFTIISFVLGAFTFLLNKKQESVVSTITKYKDSVAHADWPAGSLDPNVATSGGSDSDGGDGF
jgi:hypothetical protein